MKNYEIERERRERERQCVYPPERGSVSDGEQSYPSMLCSLIDLTLYVYGDCASTLIKQCILRSE